MKSPRCLWLRIALLILGTTLLSACLDSDARPFDEYLADLPDAAPVQFDASPTQPDARPPRPDAGPPLCSETSGAPITVEFINRTGIDGRLIWANEVCTMTQYATILDGGMHLQGTFVGHAWRLLQENDDQIIAQVIVADGQTTVTFE